MLHCNTRRESAASPWQEAPASGALCRGVRGSQPGSDTALQCCFAIPMFKNTHLERDRIVWGVAMSDTTASLACAATPHPWLLERELFPLPAGAAVELEQLGSAEVFHMPNLREQDPCCSLQMLLQSLAANFNPTCSNHCEPTTCVAGIAGAAVEPGRPRLHPGRRHCGLL